MCFFVVLVAGNDYSASLQADESGNRSGAAILQIEGSNSASSSTSAENKFVKKPRAVDAGPKAVVEDAKEEKLLHSGPMLGNLPALTTPSKVDKNSPTKYSSESIDGAGVLSGKIAADRDIRMKAKSTKSIPKPDVPSDVPQNYLCELCRKPMSDPVKSIYGNYFENSVITKWLSQQGRICPISGEKCFCTP